MLIPLKLEDQTTIEVEQGTTLLEVTSTIDSAYPIMAASVNNRLRDLFYKIEEPADIKFYDIRTGTGHGIYTRSLSFLFIKVAKEIMPGCEVMVEHSLAKGLYCEIKGKPLTNSIVKMIEKRMAEIVKNDEAFEKVKVSREEAMEIFERQNMPDKVRMFKYLKLPKGHAYKCGTYYDFFYSYLVPSAGYLKKFSLQFYLPGVIIRFPTIDHPADIPEYIAQPKLAKIYYESERWAEIMGMNTVADLNEVIAKDDATLLIQVAEALHEKKIANIAEEITMHKNRGNVILIAGPSSSGKTTFAHRLMIQLMVNGLKPISISVDNYFVDREHTPIDENGEYDFESINAIDLDLFNEHLSQLVQGGEVEMPHFNFLTGKREFKGDRVRIKGDQPIIIEGIHGLNEQLTYSIPNDHKYKIYISCLTQLNIDNHNRIPTTDARKLRRLVRDYQYRGNAALTTLRMWPSIRKGEDKNIFPFQEDADIMFNSALIYEIAILKKFAGPLLKSIGEHEEESIEAQKLLRFLSYFYSLDTKGVPPNSILREFIG